MKTKNLVIRASAGTGKTFALATRFLQLALFNKVPPERIVALTFSRNAAQEIYVKILERLWKASGGDEKENLTPEEAAARERNTLLEGLSGEDLEEARRVDCSPVAFARLLRAVVGVQDAGSIATLDSFILRVVRSFPLETGFDEVPDVLDGFGENRVASDAFSAVLSGADAESGSFKEKFLGARNNANARTVLSTLEHLLGPWIGFLDSHPEAWNWTLSSMCDAIGVAPDAPSPDDEIVKVLKATEAKLALAKLVVGARQATKRRINKFSFDDFAAALAESETGEKKFKLEAVRFRLDSMFDHWELDEFQDTSEDQWKSIRRLVEETATDVTEAAPDAKERSATVVGDLKQSIYTWRGGNDAPFKEIMEWRQFSGEYGDNISLPESHRYGRHTVDFVNAVFGPENVRAHEGNCHAAADRWVDDNCWMIHKPPKTKDGKIRADDFVEIVGVEPSAVFPDADETAGTNTSDVNDGGTAALRVLAPTICDFVVDFWKKHEGSTDTVGLLVRGNADGALLAERLRSLGVPVVWEGLSGVLDSPVVRAVLDLLSLAHHPEDVFAWKTVNDIFPLREAVFPDFSDAPSVSAAVSRMLARLGLARTLREIVAKLGATGLNDRTKLELDALVREGAAFESRPEDGGDLTRFRDWLAAAAGREIAASPDVLRILTIHRAKGLTLDHVIVPIPEKGNKDSIVVPDSRRILSGDGWALGGFVGNNQAGFRKQHPVLEQAWNRAADERFLDALRMYYVALTRARKSTHVFVVDEPAKGEKIQFRTLLLAPWKHRPPVRTETWGKVLFESGTLPPFKKKDDKTVKSSSGDLWPGVQVDPPIEHVTPSTLFHGAGPDVGIPADLPFAENAGSAAQRGVSEHAAFAAIGWIDPDAPKDERERNILGSEWREAFVETPGAALWRERSYELLVGDIWETGQFDRVVFRGEGDARTATVYDFKTNRRRDGETKEDFAERMKREYALQMAAYRRALSLLCDLPGDRIETVLLLAATKRAVPVPPLPTNVWLWDDEELGPCPAPIRLDLPSGPDNPWNPKEVLD